MLIKQDVTYNTIPDYPINYSYENFYDGTMLIRRTGQGFDAWFDYDESGSPVGMNVTTTTGPSSNPTVTTAQYYFIKNLQGDIVAMADATGAIKCSYTYNSWGKVLSVVGPNGTPSLTDHTNPANINPFRYRGYYYDAENQLYWLQSRFYDPNTGRFLNADGYVSTGQGILSTNMFLYCLNNPIRYIDESGGRCDENGPRSPWVMVTPSGRVVMGGYTSENSSDDQESEIMLSAEHHKRGTTNKSNKGKHEKGQSRKQRDNGGEKGDARRKPNPNKRRHNADYINFEERALSALIALGAFAGIVYLVGNDVTIVGIADDAAIGPMIVVLWDSLSKVFA